MSRGVVFLTLRLHGLLLLKIRYDKLLSITFNTLCITSVHPYIIIY